MRDSLSQPSRPSASVAVSIGRPSARPLPRERRPPLLVVGMILFLGSELMFFAALFGMYFTLRAHTQPWTPEDVKVDGTRLLFTSILVASSFTMQRALQHIKA